MTNFEKFRDVILNITNMSGTIAVVEDEPKSCLDIDCSICQIKGDSESSCSSKLFNWLYQEYKEKPTLTRSEYYFLMSLPKNATISINDKKITMCVNGITTTQQYVGNWFIPVLNELLDDGEMHDVSEILKLDVKDD